MIKLTNILIPLDKMIRTFPPVFLAKAIALLMNRLLILLMGDLVLILVFWIQIMIIMPNMTTHYI